MKVFIDTNILIDFIARRENFYQVAVNLISLGVKGEIKLCATPLSIATCIFITKKVLGYDGAIKAMQIIVNYFEVTAMNSSQCHNALYSSKTCRSLALQHSTPSMCIAASSKLPYIFLIISFFKPLV